MIVSVDVDETVAELLPAWLDLYNEDYDDSLRPSDVTGWDLSKFVKSECGAKIYNYLTSSLYDYVNPVPGALEGVKYLREAGHRVVFVTSTPKGSEGAKLNWLVRNGFLDSKGAYGDGRVYDDYMEVHDKSLVRADAMVDDRPENLFAFNGLRILFSAFHNKSFIGSVRPMKTANTWVQVTDHILNYQMSDLTPHITEKRCPQQAQGFRDIIERMYKVHLDKNADYSPANILGTGEIGLATRLWDKTIRYMNLLGFDIDAKLISYSGPKSARNESIEDTLQDLSVYGIIGLLMRSGKWGK